jgi:Flp pilus assembly protein TadD
MERRIFAVLILGLITVAAYARVWTFDFVDFDDAEYVRDNPAVRSGLTGEGIKWAFTTGHAANWHPLTWLSLMLDAHLYKSVSSRGYHITNVAIHIANVLLLFGLMLAMTGAPWRSACVAALLAVHPIHVESVAWISERKDVLSLLFWILATWCYVLYATRGRIHWYLASLALMAIGLMAKPTLVTLPFALFLLDDWPLKRFGNVQLRRLIFEKLPMLALTVASSVITIIVQLGSGKLDYGIWTPLSARLANALVAYVRYISKLFWPVDLAALYPNPSILGHEFWNPWQVLFAAGILLCITLAVVLLRRRRPYLVVGWLWFLGTMLPMLGIVQIGPQAMADRYAYVPFIGLYMIIAWGAGDVIARWRVAALPVGACAAMAALALTILAHQQTLHWRDSESLFRRALLVTRDNWLMHNNLGAILERQRRYDEAVDHVKSAIGINSQCAWLYDHLGTIYSQMGPERIFDAQEAFRRAVAIDPDFAKARANLGVVLAKRDRFDEAIAHLRTAAQLSPDDADIRKNLAIALVNAGRYDEAMEEIERAVKLRPGAPEYVQLRNAIVQSGSNRNTRPSP